MHSFISFTMLYDFFIISIYFTVVLSMKYVTKNPRNTSRHTIKVLLRYLAEYKRPKLDKFCCT